MVGEPKPFGRRAEDQTLRARICRRLHLWAWSAWSLLRAGFHEFWLLAVTVVVFVALILTTHAIDRVNDLVQTIQDERVANTSRACLDQNRRNTQTKVEFDRTIPRPSKRQREFTFRLVDQLAPHRDCAAVVRRTVGRSEEKRP